MLKIENVRKVFNEGTVNEKVALNGLNLHLNPGDFVTVIGGNGAGKSTMLNAVAGAYSVDEGKILIDGVDVTKLPEYKRAKFIGRVFQDPMMGTAATMQIEENLALAARRGKPRTLRTGISPKEREEYREKLVKYEEISDRIEYEIAVFLNAVSAGDISEDTSHRIKAMYKIIGELESLGDSGESISRILSRRNIHKKSFDQDTVRKLEDMVDAVEKAYDAMIDNLNAAHKGHLEGISNAYNAEDRINSLRNYLRDAEIEELEGSRKNYQASVYYMDVVSEFEKMGDFIINISQTLEKTFVKS